MIKNIIIGKNSSITRYLCKYLKNTQVFSANQLSKTYLNKNVKSLRKVKAVDLVANYLQYY